MSGLLESNRTYHIAQSSMELLPNYYHWMYGCYLNEIRGDVIELGSGAGLGISTYISQSDRIYAVDHDLELLSRVHKKYSSDKVVTIQADLLGPWDELKGVEADTVLLMDVLEHFREDQLFLEKSATLLKPEGRIILKVPCHKKLYCNIDEASGHYRRYDLEDLQILAKAAHLEIIGYRYVNPLGVLAYRRKNRSRTNFSRSFSPTSLRRINSMIPLIRYFDHFPASIGLSIIVLLKAA